MSLQIVLFQPEIPQNTGNIARTCAATGCDLHLIRPLGFAVTDKHLKRAGLDYWDDVNVIFHDSWNDFLASGSATRIWLATTKGSVLPDEAVFEPGDALVFGRETAGLPQDIMDSYPNHRVRLPMRSGTRSLNLSNAVAVLTYEALRQLKWPGLKA